MGLTPAQFLVFLAVFLIVRFVINTFWFAPRHRREIAALKQGMAPIFPQRGPIQPGERP